MSETAYRPGGIMEHQIFGLPVERNILFSNHKNQYRKKVEKRQRRLIVKIPFIKPFLKRDEKILQVTSGHSPIDLWSQYLTGFVFIYLKRSLFVFTNYRIFHVPTTPAYRYKNAVAQIPYAACQSITLKGGTLTARYAKYGKVEKFRGIGRPERRKIRSLLNKLSLGESKNMTARSHLCPQCGAQLQRKKFRCETCGLRFRHKIIASLLAIFFPGGGYFYTRHYLLGILNAVLEIYLIGYLVVTVQDMLQGFSSSLIYVVFLAVIFLAEKCISVVHSTHFVDEFIPTARRIQPKPSGASLDS